MTDQETEDELQAQADRAFVKALFDAEPDQTPDEKPSHLATTERPGRGLFAPKGETE